MLMAFLTPAQKPYFSATMTFIFLPALRSPLGTKEGHSREILPLRMRGGNPVSPLSFPRKQESSFPFVIPAKAGIQLPLCHSRESGNPAFMRDFTRELY
jgi:hypothetical protein